MFEPTNYRVDLYLNGTYVGDLRRLAGSLRWTRKRTRFGVDEIRCSVNDALWANWCEERGYTMAELLKPLALECRVVRNGVEVVGGFLATLPTYYPRQTSATLTLRFDGFLNLLQGVYIAPSRDVVTGKMGKMISDYISYADNKAEAAGKAFGFTAGTVSDMATVEQTFENYTTVKQFITNRCDNVTGAGPFDVYFHPDKTYDIVKDDEFGDKIADYVIQYPMKLNGVSAAELSAGQVSGFASAVLGIGAGEVLPAEGSEENPAITSFKVDSEAVREFGYCETLLQESSITQQASLDSNVETELQAVSSGKWTPSITLSGRQISPIPQGPHKIWIGDTVTVNNTQDFTGMTTGQFRVDVLEVSVSESNGETIQATLSQGGANGGTTFADEIVQIKRELLALKTAK